MSDLVVRKATLADLNVIKSLADVHKNELGFLLRPALANSIDRSEVFVAENSRGIVGFVEYHHRQDEQTTLYHIAVRSDHRRQGIGRRLVKALTYDANERKGFIQLKCPVDLEANEFYERLGFSQVDTDPGKHRELAVWRLQLDSATHRTEEELE